MKHDITHELKTKNKNENGLEYERRAREHEEKRERKTNIPDQTEDIISTIITAVSGHPRHGVEPVAGESS